MTKQDWKSRSNASLKQRPSDWCFDKSLERFVSEHCFPLILIRVAFYWLILICGSCFLYRLSGFTISCPAYQLYQLSSPGNPALPRFLHQLQLFLNKSSIKRLFSKEKKVECSRGWGLPGDKSFDLFSASTLS